jgi:MFS family permease
MTHERDEGAARSLIGNRNLQIVLALTTTSMLGVGSLSPAFPEIMRDFHLDTHQVGLLITVYTAPGIVLSPIAGLLADRVGRRVVIVTGLIIFALSGVACALSTSYEALLLFRFIQGLGGSPLSAVNNTVLADLFGGRQRIEALGYNQSVSSMSALMHPLIGGAVALLGWQYPMLLPLIALPVAYMVAFRLDGADRAPTGSLGAYLSTAFKGIFTRRVLALYLVNLTNLLVIYGVLLVYLVLMMKQRFDANPLTIGIILATSAVASGLTGMTMRRVATRFSPRQMIVGGMVFSGCAISLNALMPGLWWLMIPAAARGLGQGVLMPALYTALAEEAPADARAAVMGFASTMFRSGQTFGPPVFAIAYAFAGIDAVFVAGMIVSLLAATVVGVLFGSGRRSSGEGVSSK